MDQIDKPQLIIPPGAYISPALFESGLLQKITKVQDPETGEITEIVEDIEANEESRKFLLAAQQAANKQQKQMNDPKIKRLEKIRQRLRKAAERMKKDFTPVTKPTRK
jgi:ketol-acid reductoisomerase